MFVIFCCCSLLFSCSFPRFSNSSLQHLSLVECGLCESDAMELYYLLKQNRYLTWCNLSRNPHLADKGAQVMKEINKYGTLFYAH